MNAKLIETAQALLAGEKGLLAMDESNPTCNKRFARLSIPQTEAMRRDWRELIVTTPGLSESISGAILYDETIRQKTSDGQAFADVLAALGIVPGIKVDQGASELPLHPGEKVTEGLDGLRQRFADYADLGARFAKWRAVIAIDEALPSDSGIAANAQALARYAALAQEAGFVPVVEPEVLMEGAHPLQRCEAVTTAVLRAVFAELCRQRVLLEGLILKPNMVVPGLACPETASAEEVAEATLRTLRRSVPAAVPGIAFLSGGQSATLASARLNAINQGAGSPWILTFSFSRAIQQDALQIWRGDKANVSAAQQSLRERAAENRAARRGQYRAADTPHAVSL